MTAGGRCLMITAFLWVLPFSREATEVSCVFMESCILPCGFQGGTDVVVHWIQITAGGLPVHSYYRNQDQLTYQGQSFRGRTSLFKDQISRGNASLQLTGVKVQDQGIYTCFTSTMRGNNVSFIILKVDAPVGKFNIQQEGIHITCSSERIYPEPELTCSTSPPSSVTFKNQTKVQETEQLLYTISGSLILSDTDLIYSCNISTRSNWRRVTFLKTAYVTASYHEATIPCSTSNTSFSGLIWRFNHSQIILTQTRADVLYKVSEEWKQQVKGVSESGSLMLQDLSSHHEGTYTCELSDAEETLISNTVLRIEGSPHEEPSTSISVSFSEASVPCITTVTSITGFSLTWRFNHSQIILTQTRADVLYKVSEEWKQQVKGVSESGSLMLQHLSSHHEGTYTCELSDAEETLISNTVLRIEGGPHEEPSISDNSFAVGVMVITMVVPFVVGAVAVIVILVLKHQGQQGYNEVRQRELQVMNPNPQ